MFNEDFSDDANPSNPGFDQFDTYPVRDIDPNNPGDLTYDDPATPNTVQPDDVLIANNLPTSGLSGSTGRNGSYFVQNGNPGDPGWGLHAHGHILGITSSAFMTPQVTFTVPLAGTPGGLGADEEVSGIGVSAQGFGKVVIIGAIGSVTVDLPGNATWLRIAAFRDDLIGDHSTRLGAIRQLHIFSSEFVAIDNVTVEISSTVPYSPPEANDDVVIVNRDYGESEIFNPIDNDYDPQGFRLYLVDDNSYTQPARGSVNTLYDILGNFRGFKYRANADALADPTFYEDSFTYSIRNTSSAHSSATDTATVRLVFNTPPLAFFDRYEVPHGTFGTLIIDAAHGVLDNDFDRDDSDTLTITTHGQPRHGHLTVMPDGSFRYTSTTPDRRILPDGFTYTISDGTYVAHSEAFILVPNQVPIVRDDFLVIEHGLQVIEAFDVTANDPADGDGDLVSPPQIDTPPQLGTLTLLPDGRLRYVPTHDHVFSDTFTYRLADPYGESNLATVRILVPNQLPVAVNDEYRAYPETTLTVSASRGVLSNDTDADGDALFHATLTKQPGYGSVTLNDSGSFTYVPEEYYEGVDTFGYVVEDGIGQSHAATVSIVVTKGKPVARDDTYTIAPNSAPRALFLNSNDWEPDGRPLDVAISREPFHGRLLTCHCLPGEPGFGLDYYQPDPDFEGFDTFEYVALNDEDNYGEPATVILHITDDPNSLKTNSDFYSVLHERTLSVQPYGFLANDPDPPAQLNRVTLSEPPEHGTLSELTLNEGGGFIYTPNPGFVGSDTFQYRVEIFHPVLRSEAEIVSITVENQPPVARDDFFQIPVGGFVWRNVLDNDYDPDARDRDNLTVELLDSTTSVYPGTTAVLEPDGDLYFHEPSNSLRLNRLTYRVFDGAGYSQQAVINLGSYDDNSAILPAPNGNTIRAESTPGTILEASVSATPPQPTPADVEFPLGFYSFVIRNVPPGGQADVRLFVQGNGPPAMNSYWKYGQDVNDPHDVWYEFNRSGDTGAEFIGNDIVLHFVDGQRGDSDFSANGVIVDPGGPAFSLRSATIERVVINEGHAQRSKVNSISVVFSELMTIQPGAFEVRRIGARNPLKLNIQLTTTAGHTVARLTFKKGAGVVGGSVADGQYRLTIRGDKVRGADGRLLDGDADGDEGGNAVDEFFRRFGDTDGDGDVDAADKRVFTSAYGKRARQPGYLWYLDFNANGRIWAEDLALFIVNQVRHHRRP